MMRRVYPPKWRLPVLINSTHMPDQIVRCLDYLKTFRCIAGECEDTCCQGWDIRIDADTVERFASCPEPELEVTLARSIRMEEADRITPAHAARMKLTAEGKCAFLGKDKECELQKSHGLEYHSCICHRYPREENIVNGVRERSATIACPEVARQLLLRKEELRMEICGEPDRWPHLFHRLIDSNQASGPRAHHVHFDKARASVLRLMQQAKLPLETRLYRLGKLCEQLQDLVATQHIDLIPAALEEVSLRKNFLPFAAQQAVSDELLSRVLKCLCDFELVEKIQFPAYQLTLDQVRQAFGEIAAFHHLQIPAAIKKAERKYVRPFIKAYPRFFENYLVNLICKQLFPFEEERTITEQYQELLLQYTIARIHLAAAAACNSGLSAKIAITAMHTFARTWDSNAKYRAFLKESTQFITVEKGPHL